MINMHTWQAFFQILIAIGIIATAIGGLGSYFIGKNINQSERQEDQKNQEQLISKTDQVIEYLRNIKIEGSKELTAQIGKIDKWDFSIGTIEFWVRKKVFTENASLNLSILSEDNNASIKFEKDPNDKIQFIYSFPTIGKIARETRITPADINRRGVHFAFVWDLSKAETTLYINGQKRQ